jgi:hypothetical protein
MKIGRQAMKVQMIPSVRRFQGKDFMRQGPTGDQQDLPITRCCPSFGRQFGIIGRQRQPRVRPYAALNGSPATRPRGPDILGRSHSHAPLRRHAGKVGRRT